ncbi:MAG: EFR1 family ferrodoxin [Lentisphaeria bacterium]|nr:EFR1 family ferrodoxin [Lentisphaeria bacterium]
MAESTVIFWFSGTGNSYYVARRICDGLPGADLRPVVSRGEVKLLPDTHVILVAPVYSWAPPRAVQQFINRLPGRNVTRVTAVLTHGAAPGGAAALTAGQFRRAGMPNARVFTMRMVENYPPFGGAPKQEKIDKFLTAAETQLGIIRQAIAEGKHHPPSAGSRLLVIPSLLINALFRKTLPRSDKKFTVTDACNGCGTCVSVCPVNNIDLATGKPVWKGKCEQCFACFHWCPNRAILYGERSAKQDRYHHPAVKSLDIAGTAADGENE